MKEAYSAEYWKGIDAPKPKKRIIDKVLDAIQFNLAQRRNYRMFNKEFKKLEQEKVDDSHNKP